GQGDAKHSRLAKTRGRQERQLHLAFEISIWLCSLACHAMNPLPVGSPFMSPPPVMEQRHVAEPEEPGLDVGVEPGAGLGYPGLDGEMRIISREIYQGKTFDDWDDME
ncbi:unnamed protein product, partial [Ectocarpus sp. 12 AP-2014]